MLHRSTTKNAEKERLESHLAKILDYMEQLNQLDTVGVEPTSHVLPLQNVFRDDVENRLVIDSKELVKSAPKHDKGHYEVPQIIG